MSVRNVHPKVGAAKARVAVLHRDHKPAELIEAARAELAEANAEADVASWPPLTAEAKARLACLLLAPAGGDSDAA